MEKTRLTRKADQFLIEWKARKNHKPLIIQGARQIGKTECVRHLAKSYKSIKTLFQKILLILRQLLLKRYQI